MATNNEGSTTYDEHDFRKEVEAFEATKLGVKGLVDAGITRIPRMFHHPPETMIDYQLSPTSGNDDITHLIPIIDISNPSHYEVVNQVRDAATKFGFFQVINNGISISLLDSLHDGIKAFFELPSEQKIHHYSRDILHNVGRVFGFFSNHDLFNSKAATWRDTVAVQLGPTPLNPDVVPTIFRNEVVEYDKKVKKLADRLVGLLCEGLGLDKSRLTGSSYLGEVALRGHYYPYCPEPNKTIGNASHTDLGMLTILLQDEVGGLQVKHNGDWIDLKSPHGALVVNVGDLFQILSNDRYVSGEHRVYANPSEKARLSIGTFFRPVSNENLYGPLPELVTSENPAKYKQLRFTQAYKELLTTESNIRAMANYFRL